MTYARTGAHRSLGRKPRAGTAASGGHPCRGTTASTMRATPACVPLLSTPSLPLALVHAGVLHRLRPSPSRQPSPPFPSAEFPADLLRPCRRRRRLVSAPALRASPGSMLLHPADLPRPHRLLDHAAVVSPRPPQPPTGSRARRRVDHDPGAGKALLTPRAARDVARALVRFAERVRPVRVGGRKPLK